MKQKWTGMEEGDNPITTAGTFNVLSLFPADQGNTSSKAVEMKTA